MDARESPASVGSLTSTLAGLDDLSSLRRLVARRKGILYLAAHPFP
jgi:hypothetical protein